MGRPIVMSVLYWALAVVIVIAGAKLVVIWLEPRVAFHPIPGPTPPPPGFDTFSVTTADGVRITGWTAGLKPDRPVLFYHCGNAGHIGDRTDLLSGLLGHGVGVIAYNYRGTGESSGSPSEEGLYQDAEAVYHHLTGELSIDPQAIVLWGHSLGGAVACELALRRSCSGLILESTFRSAKIMANRMLPLFPVGPLMSLRLDNEAAVGRIEQPILFIHGLADDVTPADDSRRLAGLARNPEDLWLLPDAGHNDAYLAGGEAYYRRITTFAAKVTGLPPTGE